MRIVLALLALLAISVPVAAPALADEGGGSRPDAGRPEDLQRRVAGSGLNPVMKGEIRFTGTVFDQDQQAIPEIEVKLFIGGLLVESHVTDAVGQYDFSRTIDFSRGETVVLWFVDGRSRLAQDPLAPKAFVLAESPAAGDNHLLSPCFPRLQVEPTVESTIYMLDPDSRARQVSDQHCL